ncbi:predicted protein [Lichtheimia corymbifera JMRC:FSU:9682]|uniref:Uncharacterized protein n=1 Tax=Lichtheimia corymbifera JMRC:FSU:9682 TaxID=1263082 RepID=A0A068RIP4_9FUNG|nr:predicted protein [Lichtheimia corymbifera JMRC:FSU:9682]
MIGSFIHVTNKHSERFFIAAQLIIRQRALVRYSLQLYRNAQLGGMRQLFRLFESYRIATMINHTSCFEYFYHRVLDYIRQDRHMVSSVNLATIFDLLKQSIRRYSSLDVLEKASS